MNTRISQVRKAVGITQEKFAKKIGLTRNFVWMIEKGERIPSDRTIADICREFSVNENWLRTGEGEMFITLSRSEEISAFVGDILSGEPDFRARFISALARLTPKQWKQLEGITNTLISEMQKKTNQ